MNQARKETQDFILEYIDKIMPGSPNTQMWVDTFDRMSDTDFEAFIDRLESGEEIISIYMSNHGEHRIDVQRNIEIAAELGFEFYEHLILTDPSTGVTFKTPLKYPVLMLPGRRQIQMLTEKFSVPETNRVTDDLTDQPTGDSKSSSISFNELQILYGQGQINSILELIKFRGGDTKAFNYMNREIIATGEFSQESIPANATKVKANEVLSTKLTAMHLRNDL